MFRTFRHGALANLPRTDYLQIVESGDPLMPIIAPFLDATTPPVGRGIDQDSDFAADEIGHSASGEARESATRDMREGG